MLCARILIVALHVEYQPSHFSIEFRSPYMGSPSTARLYKAICSSNLRSHLFAQPLEVSDDFSNMSSGALNVYMEMMDLIDHCIRSDSSLPPNMRCLRADR